MLKPCPECQCLVSDKAFQCPHCGFPLKSLTKRSYKPKKPKLPNGFGQISEIKGRNLRNPFRAMITVGVNEFGHPISKPLQPKAYFPTYNEAYAALIEQHKNPYTLCDDVTLSELYKKWYPIYEKGVSKKTSQAMQTAWSHISELHTIRVRDLRPAVIKNFLIESPTTPSVKDQLKVLLNIIFDYAVETEVVDRNYARSVKMPKHIQKEQKKTRKEHLAFSNEEFNILWDHHDNEAIRMILMQCYSGWRPGELVEIELKNVDLENGYMTGGFKTEAGFHRIVPIHPVIKNYVEEKYKQAKQLNSPWLFPSPYNLKKHLTYYAYRDDFNEVISSFNLNPDHRPHDGRKEFITLCKKYNVDEYAIKYMAGHTIQDITESVYTDRSNEWLSQEIEKIKAPANRTAV